MIGGTGNQQSNIIDFDTSEVYDSDLGRWATSGAKLPQPTSGLRATNIDGRVLIFGNYILFISYHNQIAQEHNICRWP